MGWFDGQSQEQQYNDYNNQDGDQLRQHDPSVAHELIAGAASFEAVRAYENHCAQNGDPGDHALGKEILGGFAGAFVDREVETKGLDFIDAEEAKRQARQQCEDAYDQNGGQF